VRTESPKPVANLEDCYFYHAIELPGYGVIDGDWDFRETADQYLGNVAVAGKRVLELGPANGFFTCHMERAGATVVSYDLSDNDEWDVVPFAGQDYAGWLAARRAAMRRLNKGWWLTHDACNLQARLVNGTIYTLPAELGSFDVATACAILLHLRDPFLALQRVCERTRETVVVTELVPFRDSREFWTGTETTVPAAIAADTSGAEMIFQPNRITEPDDFGTWWHLTPQLVRQFLAVLGFEDTTTTFHVQRHRREYNHLFHTTVAHRTHGQ
jgi:hypothetical protein